MPVSFDAAGSFRQWLTRNHASAHEVKVAFAKVPLPGAFRPEEAQAEALCFGWAAGRRKALGADGFELCFRPIAASGWSARTVRLAKALIAQERMTQSGHAAFLRRAPTPTPPDPAQAAPGPHAPDLTQELRRHPAAWSNFCRLAPARQRQWIAWVAQPKTQTARNRRLAKLLIDLARQL
jgi:uncharacterized protein YdeI (YjbR/CyaY-like superfamily)